jgi:hypothetical protein
MRSLKFLQWWLLTGWLLVALVVTLSLIPPPSDLPGFPGVDMLTHLAAYGMLTLWFGFIYLRGPRYVRLSLGLIFMGGVLEFIQGISGHRSMDYYDMLECRAGLPSVGFWPGRALAVHSPDSKPGWESTRRGIGTNGLSGNSPAVV